MLPFPLSRPTSSPDATPLRLAGWAVQSLTGNYAVAFRGSLEVVFVWRGDSWHQLATRAIPTPRQAA